jgi:hypothetical protein
LLYLTKGNDENKGRLADAVLLSVVALRCETERLWLGDARFHASHA